jgi:phage FluMu protein Com
MRANCSEAQQRSSTVRSQQIRCAQCRGVILEISGDGWLEDGWATCPNCYIDTRISNANGTGIDQLSIHS